MAEGGWLDTFMKLSTTVVKGLEVIGEITDQIILAFDATKTHGTGMLWLPKGRQVLIYTFKWPQTLKTREMSEFQLQLLNVLLGQGMWAGIILCHHTEMIRNPVIKVGNSRFATTRAEKYEGPYQDKDEGNLWEKVERCKEQMNAEWKYVSQVEIKEDEHFRKVYTSLRQNHGSMAASTDTLGWYTQINCNPMQTFNILLPTLPKKYLT